MVLNDMVNLPMGCELIGKKLNKFSYAYDNALIAPTENALQYMLMLDRLDPRLEKLCLKLNVGKSCNVVFKHKGRQLLLF